MDEIKAEVRVSFSFYVDLEEYSVGGTGVSFLREKEVWKRKFVLDHTVIPFINASRASRL